MLLMSQVDNKSFMQTMVFETIINNIMDRTAQFYSQPTYMRGGVMPVFSGSRRQRGGSILGALKNVFMPMLRTVGRKGAKAALGLASDVIGDVTSGKNFTDSIKQRGIKRAKSLGADLISEATNQVQSAISNRTRAGPSRKRPASKAKQKAKRRRSNF